MSRVRATTNATADTIPPVPRGPRLGSRLLAWFNSLTLPALARFGGSQFLSLSREYSRLSTLPLEERRSLQLGALNNLLRSAVEHVPYYRERYGPLLPEGGLTSIEQLSGLPVTPKIDLMAGFPDQVTSTTTDRDSWQYVSTSGTVGRVVTVKDFERRDSERAAAVHAFVNGWGYRFGHPMLQVPPNICNLVCGVGATNEQESFRAELRKFVGARLRGRSAPLSDLRGAYERRVVYRTRVLDPLAPNGTDVPEEDFEALWDRIRDERPAILHALPEYLLLLADWAIAEGRPPVVRNLVIPMGGLASPAMRRRIVRGLGGTFLDLYGTAELGPVAFESTPGEGLRIIEDLHVVEVVRDDGTPAEAGEIGRILITDLANLAMPFVRYEVGDVGFWRPAPADSADQARRLTIVGRRDEILRDGSGAPIDPRTLRDAMIEDAGCLLFRITQKRGDRIYVDYVPQRGTAGDDARVLDVLREVLGSERKIRVRQVRSIPTEASGKFRLIKCEPDAN